MSIKAHMMMLQIERNDRLGKEGALIVMIDKRCR